jgi:hypothetical protein
MERLFLTLYYRYLGGLLSSWCVFRLTICLSRGCEVESHWLLVRFWSLGCDHVLVADAVVISRVLNFVNKLSDISDHKGMHTDPCA